MGWFHDDSDEAQAHEEVLLHPLITHYARLITLSKVTNSPHKARCPTRSSLPQLLFAGELKFDATSGNSITDDPTALCTGCQGIREACSRRKANLPITRWPWSFCVFCFAQSEFIMMFAHDVRSCWFTGGIVDHFVETKGVKLPTSQWSSFS